MNLQQLHEKRSILISEMSKKTKNGKAIISVDEYIVKQKELCNIELQIEAETNIAKNKWGKDDPLNKEIPLNI